MKIIVVDDDIRKLDRVCKLLVEAGVAVDEIDVAKTGVDARKRLSKTQYDLLILDIALPMRSGDEPDRRGGIRLLEEIVERGNFLLPYSVVGLTAFEDLYEEFGIQFHSRLWTLDYYDTSDKGWVERLHAKASYVLAQRSQKEDRSYLTDLCVVTALRSPELEAMRNLPWNWEGPRSLDEVGFYYKGSSSSVDSSFSVVAAAAPRMGMVAAALMAQRMIIKFRPKYLCMVGICAGVRGRCAIGDVIVADPAWDWQMGKYEEDGFLFAPDQIDLPTQVTERLIQLADDKNFWFQAYEGYIGTKPSNIPTIKVGPIASGSSVLSDADLVAKIQQQHRHLLGIEMELYGVYAAARDVPAPQPTVFGIKSVSDFADDTKSDKFQEYAAYMSVQTLSKFCSLYMVG